MCGTVVQSAGNPPCSFSMGACQHGAAHIYSSKPRSDGLVPYAETQLASFNPAQPYDVSLHLVVPATQSNYDLGNFMTILTLTDSANRTLATVRKPVSSLPGLCLRVLVTLSTGDHSTPVVLFLVESQHYDFANTPLIPLCIWRKPY